VIRRHGALSVKVCEAVGLGNTTPSMQRFAKRYHGVSNTAVRRNAPSLCRQGALACLFRRQADLRAIERLPVGRHERDPPRTSPGQVWDASEPDPRAEQNPGYGSRKQIEFVLPPCARWGLTGANTIAIVGHPVTA